MKVYIVLDCFTGTDGEGAATVDSVWSDKMIAQAVANSRYAHSVDDFEVGETLPEYAREEWEKLRKAARK